MKQNAGTAEGWRRLLDAGEARRIKSRYGRLPFCNLSALPTEAPGIGSLVREADGGVALLWAEEDVFRLFLALPEFSPPPLPPVAGEICCDYLVSAAQTATLSGRVEPLFLAAGFTKEAEYFQMRFCAGGMHARALQERVAREALLTRLGLSFRPLPPEGAAELERMFARELGRYDALRMPPETWAEESRQGNLLTLFTGEGALAAAYLFRPAEGRIAVARAFRGCRVSEALRMEFLAEPRWAGSRRNQYGWVAEGNEASVRGLEHIGAVRTGKRKGRYLRGGGSQ